MNFNSLVFVASALLLFTACHHEKKLALVEVDDNTVDSLNDVTLSRLSYDTTTNPFSATGSKGKVERALLNWFSDCGAKNATWRKAKYVDIVSSYYIGTIASTDLQHYEYDLSKMIDPAVYKQFVTAGVPSQSCNIANMKDFNINFLLGGKFWNTVDAQLGLAIHNAKSVSITTGNWTIDALNDQQFLDYLADSKDTKLKHYRDYLLNSDNYIITKVVKIDGFVAKICTSDTLSPTLTATLEKGWNFNVVDSASTDTTKKIGFSLKFTKAAKDTISVSSTGTIFPLVQLASGKELPNSN
ncbi:MAG: hypothetical protein P4L51_18255 [Puia sp.]|nr:hypothetical protein [Puia sp.]